MYSRLLRQSQNEGPSALDDTSVAQPTLFAIQISLSRLWEKFGLQPTQVLGHSVGEYAGATIAGVLSASDGMKIVLERGRLMQECCEEGAMLAVRATTSDLQSILESFPELEVAALNGPRRMVFGGPKATVKGFELELDRVGIESRTLPVNRAFHTSAMNPMIEQFREFLSGWTFQPPRTPMLLSATGVWLDSMPLEPDYWVEQVGAPVKFGECIQQLIRQGSAAYIEIGPKPVLVSQGREIEEEVKQSGSLWLASMHPRQPESKTMMTALGKLFFCSNADINWSEFGSGPKAPARLLPNYPFQRTTHWVAEKVFRSSSSRGNHPLLGEVFTSPGISSKLHIFNQKIDISSVEWLSHHKVFGNPVLPAAGSWK